MAETMTDQHRTNRRPDDHSPTEHQARRHRNAAPDVLATRPHTRTTTRRLCTDLRVSPKTRLGEPPLTSTRRTGRPVTAAPCWCDSTRQENGTTLTTVCVLRGMKMSPSTWGPRRAASLATNGLEPHPPRRKGKPSHLDARAQGHGQHRTNATLTRHAIDRPQRRREKPERARRTPRPTELRRSTTTRSTAPVKGLWPLTKPASRADEGSGPQKDPHQTGYSPIRSARRRHRSWSPPLSRLRRSDAETPRRLDRQRGSGSR
jgi:hypothetical protein